MLFSPDYLAPHLPKLQAASHCYVGYSGGLDSHVLLHALVQLLGPKSLTAIHVNHQLSSNAEHWQQHCQAQCDELGVLMVANLVSVENVGQGLEQAARDARYAVFNQQVNASELLLLAHHADDQVETVLYRLMRGAGSKGLAGMPMQRSLDRSGHSGEILRPLLPFSRQQLATYATANGLQWIEDESNQETVFDRNFLRQKVVPVLAERWPDYAARIIHSAALSAEAHKLAEILAAQDLINVYERSERVGWSIVLESLMVFDAARQANILRYWADLHGLPQPGHRAIDAMLCEVLPARQDASPIVSWGDGVQLRRFQKRLYLLPASLSVPWETVETTQFAQLLSWNFSDDLVLPDGSVLAVTVEQGQGLAMPAQSGVEIRFRSGGERCKPAGRSGSNTLKKLFQEYGLEPWLRDRIPLIYLQGELVAVGDLWVCDGFTAIPQEQGVVLQWRFPS